MGKLWLRAESAVARVELPEDGIGDLVDQRKTEVCIGSAAGEVFILLDGGHHAGGGVECFLALGAEEATAVGGEVGDEGAEEEVLGTGERPRGVTGITKPFDPGLETFAIYITHKIQENG